MKTLKNFRIYTSDKRWWHVQDLTDGKIKLNLEARDNSQEYQYAAKHECECWLINNLIWL